MAKKELTLTTGAKLDNNGTLTVGTGSAGTAGELKVTTVGTLGVVLDGTNAAINVGAAAADTSTVTGWKMEAGSKLEIGFTEDVLGTAKVSDNDDTKSYELDVLVAKVADGSSVTPDDFGCTYQLGDIAETDAIHWTGSDIGLATKFATGADIYLTITLTYNPWIDIQNGGTNNESYGDASAEKELYYWPCHQRKGCCAERR